jgi:type I restriction enzyme, S subunit
LNGAFGLIPPELDGYESTLDLPAFNFQPEVDPRWFLYHVSREDFYQGHLGLANGGRKARRVNPPDLLRVAIPVPSFPEQQAIADAIDVAIADEKAWLTMLEALKAEKRALMQQLLTGKRRVKMIQAQASA